MTPSSRPICLTVRDASRTGEARRLAVDLAQDLGFDDTGCGKVAVVVTEAVNNLARHGGGGSLVVQALAQADAVGLEVLALDKGPGMADAGRCQEDGYSTGGTPGTGLGAIKRQSTLFDIYSRPGIGTALLAQLWKGCAPGKPPASGAHQTGAVCLPYPGEKECGDAWAADHRPGRSMFMLSDGLGHGVQAAEASQEAARIFRRYASRPPAEILETMHGALRSTRGAAIAIAEITMETRSIRYAGVGNISGAVLEAGHLRSMVSHNGTIGHQARKFQEFDYPWPKYGLLVMHSDGLSAQWSLDRYPGLLTRHPALVAGVLYRDCARGRDDATVLVARDPDAVETASPGAA
jgi:anti-sigma regulatory factor (Ser/Thr protein kinase)